MSAWLKLKIAEPSVGFDSQELVNIEVSRRDGLQLGQIR